MATEDGLLDAYGYSDEEPASDEDSTSSEESWLETDEDRDRHHEEKKLVHDLDAGGFGSRDGGTSRKSDSMNWTDLQSLERERQWWVEKRK